MPRRAKSLSELMRERRGRAWYDAEQKRKRKADPNQALADRLRTSQRWKKLRRMKLARDPLCADCLERGVTEPATQVHHSVPVRERPDLAFVMELLVALCTTCHARREAEEPRRR